MVSENEGNLAPNVAKTTSFAKFFGFIKTYAFQVSVYSPNGKSATDAVVPLLTNSLASSSHRSFRLDDSHSSMAKPVADRMKGFRAKGDLVGNINLKVCRAVDETSDGKEQMLMFGKIHDRAYVESGVCASADFHRGAMIHFGSDQNIFREIGRSEEHTSELQSLRHLVCRLL